jgi:mRNA-degrading endonuclease RelE of RelBE toxin-antitoxin system
VVEVEYLENFEKSFKRIFKKYRHTAQEDLKKLIAELQENPTMGIDLGHNLYKVRVENSAKNRGKSAGFRVATYYIDENNRVYLVHIYDKSKTSNVSKERLMEIIKRELD